MGFDKILEWVKKHIFLSVIIAVFISLMPLLIIQLLFGIGSVMGKIAFSTPFSEVEILSYYSEIWGALIGAIATFGALYITIKHEKNERKDDRRLSVYPYLEYSIVKEKKDEDIQHIFITPKLEDLEILRKNENEGIEYKYDIIFCLQIENIGLGSAINVSIMKAVYMGLTDISIIGFGNIIVSEKQYINFFVLINAGGELEVNRTASGIINIDLIVAYENVLGDYYEQNMSISCNWSGTTCNDEIIDIGGFNAYIGKNSVSEPVLKATKIKIEEDNKINSFFKRDKKIDTN